MSSKYTLQSIPGNINSQLTSVLTALASKQDQSDRNAYLDARDQRRYDLQMARQNRLDASQEAARSREESRYQDTLKRIKQKEEDLLTGSSYGITTQFDPKMIGDVTTETKENINMVTGIGADRMQKIIEADEDKYLAKDIKRNTEKDLEFEKKYNAISDPKSFNYIKDPNKRKIAQLDIADEYDITEEKATLGLYPGGIPSLIPYGGAKITEGIARAFSPIVNQFIKPRNAAMVNIAIDDFSKMIDKKYKSKSQDKVMSEKLESIQDIREKRIGKEKIINQNLINLMNKNTQKVLFKKTITEKDMALPREKWNKNRGKDIQDAYGEIMDSSMNNAAKTEAIKELKIKIAQKDALYEVKQSAKAKRSEKIWEKQLDTSAKKSIKKYEAEIKQMEKELETDPENQSLDKRLKLAKLGLINAQTKAANRKDR